MLVAIPKEKLLSNVIYTTIILPTSRTPCFLLSGKMKNVKLVLSKPKYLTRCILLYLKSLNNSAANSVSWWFFQCILLL